MVMSVPDLPEVRSDLRAQLFGSGSGVYSAVRGVFQYMERFYSVKPVPAATQRTGAAHYEALSIGIPHQMPGASGATGASGVCAHKGASFGCGWDQLLELLSFLVLLKFLDLWGSRHSLERECLRGCANVSNGSKASQAVSSANDQLAQRLECCHSGRSMFPWAYEP